MNQKQDLYITLNGLKGVWTLNEVVELLQNHGLKVKISTNGASHAPGGSDLHNQVDREEVNK